MEDLRMTEILVIDQIDLARHAQIFNRKQGYFPFFQFVKAGAFRKY